jgi:hypothetical protein
MNKIETQKEIIAQTFTPIYDEVEDRIRVVINYQDIMNRVDYMITRKFILNIIPTIDEFILKHYSDHIDIENNLNYSSSLKLIFSSYDS